MTSRCELLHVLDRGSARALMCIEIHCSITKLNRYGVITEFVRDDAGVSIVAYTSIRATGSVKRALLLLSVERCGSDRLIGVCSQIYDRMIFRTFARDEWYVVLRNQLIA